MQNEITGEAPLRLVMCTADGQPDEPGIDLPQPMQQYAAACADLYERLGFAPPWVSYIVLDGDLAVGGGAFVGPPKNGVVEIAYYTLPPHENRGVATFTAGALVEITRRSKPCPVVTAKTLPLPNASTTILARLGFQHVGSVIDDDVGEAWEWQLRLPD